MEIRILSVGGSIICPDEIDYFFLKKFKQLILERNERFVIFSGGGKLSAEYITAAKRVSDISRDNLDWLGIMATRLNAELVRCIFGDYAHQKVIYNPNEKIKTSKRIIIAAGWKPGWSTDYDAVLMAKQMKSKEILNLTNIKYVFNKDPRKHSDAEPLRSLTWKQYRKIIGSKWSPRLSTPFDPIASREAEKQNIKVVILKGTDLDNLENYMDSKQFEGTVIE